MRRPCSLPVLLSLILAGCAGQTIWKAEESAELTILTEEYAPLSFTAAGEITGQATEVVRELVKRTGIAAEIRMGVWEDVYQKVLDNPRTALFSTVMTAERKDLLQWVGPITILNTNLYALKGSGIAVRTLDEARKAGKVAAVAEYYSTQSLKSEGFTDLVIYADEESALRGLLNGEARLLVSNNTVLPALLKKVGAAANDVEIVFTVSTDMTYIAFSPDTPREMVDRWQDRLDEMKRDGTFQKIYARWLPDETPPGLLQLLTEEYPPVTFAGDGRISGFVTDMVREICERLGIPDNIRLTSWKNAYTMALVHPNVVLFSADRTEAREDLFQWVGPVGQNSAILFARKGSGITVDSMEDARNVASIATTTQWWTEQYLQAAGFTNLVSSQDPADNVRQLMRGEVKLAIFTDITIPEIARNAGYGMEDLEPVFTVKDNYFYIAISRGTPRETVDKWQSVLNEMKEDGTFAAIYGKYLPRAEIGNLVSQR